MRQIGRTFDPVFLDSGTVGRAVAAIGTFRYFAIEFDKLRIINVCTERFFNCIEISAVTVRCELDAVGKTVLYIIHECQRIFAITTANQP